MSKFNYIPLFVLLALSLFFPFCYGSKGRIPVFYAPPTKEGEAPQPLGPWFTGPLLTQSGHVVPGGNFNFEPYTFVNVTTGSYDKHWHAHSAPNFYNVNFTLPTQIGLTSWMDFQISPQASYNSTEGRSSLQIGDFPLQLDFQLLLDSPDNYVPGIKFYVAESFPLGKYQKLDPERLGTDSGGSGSYITSLGFVFTRLFHLGGLCYLSTRLNPFYAIPSSVNVKKFNTYGGAEDTKGTVRPGNRFGAFFGMELSLSQNWAFAFDAAGLYANKTRFSGRQGAASAPIKKPSSLQFSLAPAIEYNFSASVGIIAGSWFTVGGRNTSRFASGVIAINYYGPFSSAPEPKPKKQQKPVHHYSPFQHPELEN